MTARKTKGPSSITVDMQQPQEVAPAAPVVSGVMFLTEPGLVNEVVLTGTPFKAGPRYVRLETLFDDSIDQTKLLARRFW